MADEPKSKKPSTDLSVTSAESATSSLTADAGKPKRRVLRPTTEPSTLRQQSEAAQVKATQPRRRGQAARAAGRPFVVVGRLLRRIFRPLGRFRLFRVIGYILAPPYIRNSLRELRQVTWPDRRQSWSLTYAVIIFSLIFGCIAALVDFGLDRLFRTVILNH